MASCSAFLGQGLAAAQAQVARAPAARRGGALQTRALFASNAKGEAVYPEWGTFPGGPGESPIFPFSDAKSADVERIHGRWAMLAVTGIIAQENAGKGAWFNAGLSCLGPKCDVQYVDPFGFGPGNVSTALIVMIEALLIGFAEAYRTGLIDPAWPDEFSGGEVLPGGRFDPLNLAGKPDNAEALAIAELKHGRLAMMAWTGCVVQGYKFNPNGPSDGVGAMANRAAHIADPFGVNIFTV